MASNLRISILLDCYGPLLSKKQQELISCYYNEDLSLSEIAENEGVSRQAIHESIKKSQQQLETFENKLHFVEKTMILKKQAESIVSDDEKTIKLCDFIEKLF